MVKSQNKICNKIYWILVKFQKVDFQKSKLLKISQIVFKIKTRIVISNIFLISLVSIYPSHFLVFPIHSQKLKEKNRNF